MASHWFEQVPGSPRQYLVVFPGAAMSVNVTEAVTHAASSDPASPTFASGDAAASPGVEPSSPPALPSGAFPALLRL
jgi:hypothetical protein